MARLIKEILEEALSNARAKGLIKGSTNVEEAEFLEISPALLSRLKGNKAGLTDSKIKSIAAKLGGDDSSYREQLERELFFSRDETKAMLPSSTSRASLLVSSVEDLFRRLSNPDSLLCVDYRDLPQTVDGGEYPLLADEASKGIAAGLSFAMFQSFGTVEDLESDLIQSIKNKTRRQLQGREYLLRLGETVREVYHKIKSKVREFEVEGVKPGQVVLYEAKNLVSVTGCGINSRLFLINCADENGRYDKQIYQWIDGLDGDDYFIRRDNSTLNQEAVSQQFFPVTDYWTFNNRKIPESDKELEKFVKSLDQRFAKVVTAKEKRDADSPKLGLDKMIGWKVYDA